ncbi:MAG: TetR/AcrR family transcriptional regulator [Beijerinckiaceae bacterium]
MAKLRSREVMKDEFIVIGEALIEAEGLAALQARAVAERAGCSVGTIYNSFETIDGLILAVNVRTLGELGQRLRKALAGNEQATLANRLGVLAFAYLDFAATHTLRWRAVFEHNMSARQPVPDWYRAAQAPLFGLLAQTLPEAMNDHRRKVASHMLFAAAHGVVTLALDTKLTDHFDREATEDQLRMLVTLAGKGLEEG